MIVCAVSTQGEYGYNDLFLGLPVILGRGGAEKIIEMSLNETEQVQLDHSADAVRAVVEVLGYGEGEPLSLSA